MEPKEHSIRRLMKDAGVWSDNEFQTLMLILKNPGTDYKDWKGVADVLRILAPRNNPPKTPEQCQSRWLLNLKEAQIENEKKKDKEEKKGDNQEKPKRESEADNEAKTKPEPKSEAKAPLPEAKADN